MIKKNKLIVGEMISLTDYFTVRKINTNSIEVEDRTGNSIEIIGNDLIESKFHSSAQFSETIKCGKNELAEKLANCGDKVFTVCFEKQDNSERILIGYFISSESFLGRTKVIDLNISPSDKTKGIRLIDNRTIKWLVVEDKRYIAQ